MLNDDERGAIAEQNGWRCVFCDASLDWNNLHIEDDQATCGSCSSSRGDTPFNEFLGWDNYEDALQDDAPEDWVD